MESKRFDDQAPADKQASEDLEQRSTVDMPGAKDLRTRSELLKFSADSVVLDGLWLEFGVYKGKSLRKIAAQTDQRVYGFDSFEGLPEDWVQSYRQGDFSLKGRIPQDLPPHVTLVKGAFAETLPPFVKANIDPVAFLHIDCDLYNSTRTIFTHLRPRITKGTIILFDEFHNFPGWRQHEYRAFMEFIEESRSAFEYIGFASEYISVAARITAVTGAQSNHPEKRDN